MTSDSLKLSQYNIATRYSDDRLIILNTRTQAVVMLDKDKSKIFEDTKIRLDKLGSSVVASMKKGGFIVDAARNEYREMLAISKKARTSKRKLTIVVAPTMECNFVCPYCFETNKVRGHMKETVQNELVKFIEMRLRNYSGLHVVWYGGEPLLSLNIVQLLTDKIKALLLPSQTYASSIITNGFLLTESAVDRLLASDITSAQVTVDGPPNTHNLRRILADGSPTYARIIKNINSCCSKLDICVRVNVDSTNLSKAGELLDDLAQSDEGRKIAVYLAAVDNSNNISGLNRHCLSWKDLSKKEMAFYRKARRLGLRANPLNVFGASICGAVCSNTFVIDPMGRIYKCLDEVGIPGKEECTLEDYEHVDSELDNSRWSTYEPRLNSCFSCEIFPLCFGGCPKKAMEEGEGECTSLRDNVLQRMLINLSDQLDLS